MHKFKNVCQPTNEYNVWQIDKENRIQVINKYVDLQHYPDITDNVALRFCFDRQHIHYTLLHS